jgi:hypothetical protein
MTEIRKTLEILKARWREIVLIIALDVLTMSVNMMQTIFHPMKTSLRILIMATFLVFNIIMYLLIFGFQRTVYTEDLMRQSPLVLLREGKHFFLPLAGLSIIYGIALIFLQTLVLWAIKQVPFVDKGFMETRWGASLFNLSYSTSFNLVLMKPILLIFPIIIVLDCDILTSFKMLGRCRLRDARELVILFLISLGLPFLLTFLPSKPAMAVSYCLITTARIIVWRFIALIMAVMAIRFVASQNLIYDNGSKPLDSQGSLNPSI